MPCSKVHLADSAVWTRHQNEHQITIWLQFTCCLIFAGRTLERAHSLQRNQWVLHRNRIYAYGRGIEPRWDCLILSIYFESETLMVRINGSVRSARLTSWAALSSCDIKTKQCYWISCRFNKKGRQLRELMKANAELFAFKHQRKTTPDINVAICA